MADEFPITVKLGSMRGVISIIREEGGSVLLSKLFQESEGGIDDLLPVLNACRMLGLITMDGGYAKLTETGLAAKDLKPIMRAKLPAFEPFKTAIAMIKDSPGIPTEELFDKLTKKEDIQLEGVDIKTLRKTLISWLVRDEIVNYDQDRDTWS